jgi:hypothetical protein
MKRRSITFGGLASQRAVGCAGAQLGIIPESIGRTLC